MPVTDNAATVMHVPQRCFHKTLRTTTTTQVELLLLLLLTVNASNWDINSLKTNH